MTVQCCKCFHKTRLFKCSDCGHRVCSSCKKVFPPNKTTWGKKRDRANAIIELPLAEVKRLRLLHELFKRMTHILQEVVAVSEQRHELLLTEEDYRNRMTPLLEGLEQLFNRMDKIEFKSSGMALPRKVKDE